MKTAEKINQELKEHPSENPGKVTNFLTSEEEYLEENYSEEDLAKINHDAEEAKQGINVERFNSMNEALQSLGLK